MGSLTLDLKLMGNLIKLTASNPIGQSLYQQK
jgi:hypothetical protein